MGDIERMIDSVLSSDTDKKSHVCLMKDKYEDLVPDYSYYHKLGIRLKKTSLIKQTDKLEALLKECFAWLVMGVKPEDGVRYYPQAKTHKLSDGGRVRTYARGIDKEFDRFHDYCSNILSVDTFFLDNKYASILDAIKAHKIQFPYFPELIDLNFSCAYSMKDYLEAISQSSQSKYLEEIKDLNFLSNTYEVSNHKVLEVVALILGLNPQYFIAFLKLDREGSQKSETFQGRSKYFADFGAIEKTFYMEYARFLSDYFKCSKSDIDYIYTAHFDYIDNNFDTCQINSILDYAQNFYDKGIYFLQKDYTRIGMKEPIRHSKNSSILSYYNKVLSQGRRRMTFEQAMRIASGEVIKLPEESNPTFDGYSIDFSISYNPIRCWSLGNDSSDKDKWIIQYSDVVEGSVQNLNKKFMSEEKPDYLKYDDNGKTMLLTGAIQWLQESFPDYKLPRGLQQALEELQDKKTLLIEDTGKEKGEAQNKPKTRIFRHHYIIAKAYEEFSNLDNITPKEIFQKVMENPKKYDKVQCLIKKQSSYIGESEDGKKCLYYRDTKHKDHEFTESSFVQKYEKFQKSIEERKKYSIAI